MNTSNTDKFFLCHIKRAGSSFETVALFSATNSQILEYHFNEASHKPYTHLFNFQIQV